jgi:hypothetical protein
MLDFRSSLVRLLPRSQPRICAAPKNATVSSEPRRDSGDQRHGVTNDCTLRERGKRARPTSAGFHANQMDLPVRGEAQQPRLREILPHNHLTPFVQTYQVKVRLTEIKTDRVYLHGMPPSFIFDTLAARV